MKAYTEAGTAITIDDRYEIKRGGEGKILTIPELPTQVAKIYLSANYQHMSKAQKDALACLDDNVFVKPLELIYSKKSGGNILGFTMAHILPEFVPLAAFYNKNYGISAGISDDFKLNIAKKIVQGVQAAHAQGVIIGDLSGLNILVSPQQEVRFIDTDSYETAVHTHWGLLLDEIRDYLYQGKVSKESDYFALSVILFNLFTHLHPFKGVHKHVKSMAERMLLKLPVFAQDNDLILPKCYQPIQDVWLQEQFDDVFFVGKRFLLKLSYAHIAPPTVIQKVGTPIIQTSLKYKEVYTLQAGESFRKAYFVQRQGYVQTNTQTFLYDSSNQGYLTHQYTFAHEDGVAYFVGNKNLLRQRGTILEVWQGGQKWLVLKNAQLSTTARLFQMQDILTVLDGDFTRLLHIDDIIQDQIRIDQTPTFTAGFDTLYSLVQNVGGVQYVWYHSGKTLSTVKTAIPIQNALISGHVGLAIYETNLHGEIALAYEYFALQNMHMKMSGEVIHGLRNFAIKTVNAQTAYIFEPADDKIIVRNAETAKVLQEMACSLISTETALQMTNGGIIAFEKDFCYLLNT